jgi:hypothetical protein
MEQSALEKRDIGRIGQDLLTVQEQYGIAEMEFGVFVKENS